MPRRKTKIPTEEDLDINSEKVEDELNEINVEGGDEILEERATGDALIVDNDMAKLDMIDE